MFISNGLWLLLVELIEKGALLSLLLKDFFKSVWILPGTLGAWLRGKQRGSCRSVGETWSNPDLLSAPFFSLMKDFLIVIVRLNGDSEMLKFKFDFLMKPKRSSLVWFASILRILGSLN